MTNEEEKILGLWRVHAELMGKATEHRIIADHIKSVDAAGHMFGAFYYHKTAADAYETAAGRVLVTRGTPITDADTKVGPMTASIHGRTITLRWPDGTPVYAGQIKEDAPVRYDLKTGIVEGIEKP